MEEAEFKINLQLTVVDYCDLIDLLNQKDNKEKWEFLKDEIQTQFKQRYKQQTQ